MEKEKESLKQQAYHIIKNKIIYCEYPPNANLNEAMLLEDTGCSRTPIRDALSRLEQERLLTIMPKKGVRVSDVTINDITTVYEMRSLIEPYVIRNYGKKMDKEKLGNMRQCFDKSVTPEHIQAAEKENRLADLYKLDDDFHQYIVRCSGNMYMQMSMEQIYNQNIRLRVLTSINRSRLMASHPEHTIIIDYLLLEQYEEAAKAMEKHLENAKQVSFKAIISNGGWVI